MSYLTREEDVSVQVNFFIFCDKTRFDKFSFLNLFPGARIQSGNFQVIEYHSNIGMSPILSVNRIEFLQGYKVSKMAAGQDFTVVIVFRDNEEESKSEQIGEQSSAKSCPLGLPIHENEVFSDGESFVQLRKKRDIPRKHEADKELLHDDEDDQPNVERLAKSGMYINPSDAFKYLSNQLSWIGIGVNANTGVMEDQRPSQASIAAEATEVTNDSNLDEESSNNTSAMAMSKATNFVSDSMKAVGETVSRLSKSFSTEKSPTINDELQFDDIATMTADSSSIIPLSPLDSSSKSSEISPRRTEDKFSKIHRAKTFRSTPNSTNNTLTRRSRSVSFGIDGFASRQNDTLSKEKDALKNNAFDAEVFIWGKGKRGQQVSLCNV